MDLDVTKCCYHVLFVKQSSDRASSAIIKLPYIDKFNSSLDMEVNTKMNMLLNVNIPKYCNYPNRDNITHVSQLKVVMHAHIISVMSYQCPDAAYTCRPTSSINPLTPCIADIALALAEDYAWSKGWCSVIAKDSLIPSIETMDIEGFRLKEYSEARKRLSDANTNTVKVQLLFCIFAHNDSAHLLRLLERLYNQKHMYVIMVDKGSRGTFNDISLAVNRKYTEGNVIVACPEHIIYKTSSIAMLTVKFLSWSLKYIPNWDHVVFLTGADYPLIPLYRLEDSLAKTKPGIRLFAWGDKPMNKIHANMTPKAKRAILLFFNERKSLSPLRGSHQFGIPLTCGGQRLYARFPIRITRKANSPKHRYDTQVNYRY